MIDHYQAAGNIPSLFFGDEAQLLAIDAEICFNVVHDRVRFRLLAESRVFPVLGNVVGFSFGCDVVILNQLFKNTQLQDTASIIMLALVSNTPKVLSLAELVWLRERE